MWEDDHIENRNRRDSDDHDSDKRPGGYRGDSYFLRDAILSDNYDYNELWRSKVRGSRWW